MTQSSGFWDGTTLGHAASGVYTAPYDANSEFGRMWSRALGSDDPGFVLPGVLNNLKVEANTPAAANVLVNTGAAFIKGFHYLNDAQETLTIAANAAGNPRLDRIVLRASWAAQTVVLAVLQGAAAAVPSLPALTQVYGTTWEVSLGYVWVANGFASIADTDVHDEREFASTFRAVLDAMMASNLITNSEFMGYGALSSVAAPVTVPPDTWALVLTPSAFAGVAKPAQMSRGRGVQITCNANHEGMAQTRQIRPSVMHSLRILVNVTAGDVGEIVVTTDSGAPNTITRYVRRTGAWIEEKIYYLAEADATTITVQLLCANNGDIVAYGQILLVEGYIPGPFRQIHEIIMADRRYDDTNWWWTLHSTGTTDIDLDADFDAVILPGTRAVYVILMAFDSGSAGAAADLHAEPTGSTGQDGSVKLSVYLANNTAPSWSNGWVALNAANQFTLRYTASGVNTLRVYAYIMGVQT